MSSSNDQNGVNRRSFIQTGGTIAAAAGAVGTMSFSSRSVHAGEDNTIRVALIGCGGEVQEPDRTHSPSTMGRSSW